MRPTEFLRAVLLAALPYLLTATLLAASSDAMQLASTRVTPTLFARPTFLTSPPRDFHRMFVTEQWTGLIRVVKDGVVLPQPFLAITEHSTGFEQGLLGLAFHPDYATNGRFYVDFTDVNGDTRIREYTVSASDPDVADPASAREILIVPHPINPNHNGGCLQFGHDGFLYQGMGDGGGANDPPNNAQNLDVLLGKILRIDVDGDDFPADPLRNYAIPAGNPFAGATAGADEIWHYGLRNPWRFSFDRVSNDLWIGDVGQGAVEEIDFVPTDVAGLDFGWRCMEGDVCTGLGGCTCDAPELTDPIHVYTHADGCTVIGGHVYRGLAVPEFRGTYVFADYCSNRIWSLRYAPDTGVTELTDRTSELDPPGAASITSIQSFGEDARGELYVLEEDGEIWRITSASRGDLVCPGDGSSVAQLACPCSNFGATDHGCASSANPAGALLTAEGSLDPDTLRLVCSGLPSTTACVFLGGDAFDALGVLFGDGVRCVGGALVRLSMKTAVDGVAFFPEFRAGDPSVSARSGVVPGSGATRTYQAFYRNTAPFCTPETFNISSGRRITW